ncbi:hypothetical protein VTN02DRAFT_6041 [Thermoascus thermophilus]
MPLAASTLSLPDVEKIFGLKEDSGYRSIWHLDKHDLVPVPESLYGKLADISSILGPDPANEAICRLRLHAILFDCIKAERALLASPQQARSDEGLSKKPVSLMLESRLSLEVQFQNSRRLLQGKSDYSVWYDDVDMATNLVIVEAKTRGVAGSGIAQCLAYMAMVHQIRKGLKKPNAIVYGCCSDGYRFDFLKIDNESRYTQWHCQQWGSKDRVSESEIYTHLRCIIRAAVRSSSSPRKGDSMVDDTATGRPYRVAYTLRVGSAEEDEDMDDLF